jgi:hypothetical protein
MKAQTVLKKAFVDLEKIADKMNPHERGELVRELEGISLRAGEMAAYLFERYGYGSGDQGHSAGVKALKKAGKIIWIKAFGYNAYHDLNF